MSAPQIPVLKLAAQGIEKLLTELQTNINKALQAVAVSADIAQGRLVVPTSTIPSSASQTRGLEIPHGLGRPPKGWLVVRKFGPGDVWETTSPTPEKTLWLTASQGVSVVLWVF